MLYQKNDSGSYILEFKKRFGNFCEKAPLLLSYTTTPVGVQVINESTNDIYEIGFDYSIPVKVFIHGIKTMLVERNCYPIMHKVEGTEEGISSDEQISMAVEGVPVDKIPVKRYKKKIVKYLIDKCIIFKDILIIKNMETEEMFRYKLNKSCVFFLKKIRSGKLNPEEAAEYFFSNSVLLNKIELLEDQKVQQEEV